VVTERFKKKEKRKEEKREVKVPTWVAHSQDKKRDAPLCIFPLAADGNVQHI